MISSSSSLMNVPPTMLQIHEEESSPRRVSLDEISLKDIANRYLNDDDVNLDFVNLDTKDEAAIIQSCISTNKKRGSITTTFSSPSSLRSCIHKKAKVATNLSSPRNKKLLRFVAEPTILGTSALVEHSDDVWYSRQELAAIRQDCKAAIVSGCINRDNVAQEIMRLYNNIEATAATTETTTAEMKHTISAEFFQLRGLERWTSQLQYHIRQVACKTLRSELYIAQSSERLVAHTGTAHDDPARSPQERLAEISRTHSQKAVAWAFRLAQVDAMR
jgi:hypothetical protein